MNRKIYNNLLLLLLSLIACFVALYYNAQVLGIAFICYSISYVASITSTYYENSKIQISKFAGYVFLCFRILAIILLVTSFIWQWIDDGYDLINSLEMCMNIDLSKYDFYQYFGNEGTLMLDLLQYFINKNKITNNVNTNLTVEQLCAIINNAINKN